MKLISSIVLVMSFVSVSKAYDDFKYANLANCSNDEGYTMAVSRMDARLSLVEVLESGRSIYKATAVYSFNNHQLDFEANYAVGGVNYCGVFCQDTGSIRIHGEDPIYFDCKKLY